MSEFGANNAPSESSYRKGAANSVELRDGQHSDAVDKERAEPLLPEEMQTGAVLLMLILVSVGVLRVRAAVACAPKRSACVEIGEVKRGYASGCARRVCKRTSCGVCHVLMVRTRRVHFLEVSVSMCLVPGKNRPRHGQPLTVSASGIPPVTAPSFLRAPRPRCLGAATTT